MKLDENGENDYREEAGKRRHLHGLQRALNRKDPYYPSELHRQDVLDFYSGVNKKDLNGLPICEACQHDGNDFEMDYGEDGSPVVICSYCGNAKAGC